MRVKRSTEGSATAPAGVRHRHPHPVQLGRSCAQFTGPNYNTSLSDAAWCVRTQRSVSAGGAAAGRPALCAAQLPPLDSCAASQNNPTWCLRLRLRLPCRDALYARCGVADGGSTGGLVQPCPGLATATRAAANGELPALGRAPPLSRRRRLSRFTPAEPAGKRPTLLARPTCCPRLARPAAGTCSLAGPWTDAAAGARFVPARCPGCAEGQSLWYLRVDDKACCSNAAFLGSAPFVARRASGALSPFGCTFDPSWAGFRAALCAASNATLAQLARASAQAGAACPAGFAAALNQARGAGWGRQGAEGCRHEGHPGRLARCLQRRRATSARRPAGRLCPASCRSGVCSLRSRPSMPRARRSPPPAARPWWAWGRPPASLD